MDLNPEKQGKYSPKTEHLVVSPQFLRHYSPDLILIMNPIYQAEIEQMGEYLGLNCQYLGV